MVQFVVDRQGRVSRARLARPSGTSALDRETLAMLDRADLPPLPRTIPENELTIVAPVLFALR